MVEHMYGTLVVLHLIHLTYKSISFTYRNITCGEIETRSHCGLNTPISKGLMTCQQKKVPKEISGSRYLFFSRQVCIYI